MTDKQVDRIVDAIKIASDNMSVAIGIFIVTQFLLGIILIFIIASWK